MPAAALLSRTPDAETMAHRHHAAHQAAIGGVVARAGPLARAAGLDRRLHAESRRVRGVPLPAQFRCRAGRSPRRACHGIARPAVRRHADLAAGLSAPDTVPAQLRATGNAR
ncbi:hypothetical protein LUTEI9C_20011 [Luteimonas sp. 9C]|nr:hypothetical protein LUTEI9C_20011 [Luteimonas sp. 9C]